MAILTGQNIGANQKGILNLGSTINTPLSATLQAITDGEGNASPLQLSTTSVNVGRAGLDGSLSITSTLGTNVLSLTARSGGFSNAVIGSNDINFYNFQTGYVFATGSTWISPLARLHVRGDGTNPIARFENSGGTNAILFDTTGLRIISSQAASSRISLGTGAATISGGWGGASGFSVNIDNAVGGNFTGSVASAVQGLLNIVGTFANATVSGNAIFRPVNIGYTINNTASQSGTATGIFLNATETALNGMGHNLLDLQVGGSSRFRVDNTGYANASGFQVSLEFRISGKIRIASPSDGLLTFYNNGSNDFNRLQLGGTTNAFPAIKRNGAAIDFVRADDSAFCNVSANNFIVPSNGSIGISNGSRAINFDAAGATNLYTAFGGHRFSIFNTSAYVDFVTILGNTASPSVLVGTTSNVASSLFTIESTTRGFLPPRMTTTQINAIASPAEGLVVYSTTANALCLYTGSSWRKLNDSPL
jgi:hypothetical protein